MLTIDSYLFFLTELYLKLTCKHVQYVHFLNIAVFKAPYYQIVLEWNVHDVCVCVCVLRSQICVWYFFPYFEKYLNL